MYKGHLINLLVSAWFLCFFYFWFWDLIATVLDFALLQPRIMQCFFSFVVFPQATAYYYHGLILDEGNTEKSHGMAVAALQAADEYLKESKRACEAFNMAPPLSR